MRSILVVLLVFGSLPVIVIKPHVGVLVWSWIGYMNPHRLTWGVTYHFPFAMVVGVVTIAAWLFSREPKSLPWHPLGRVNTIRGRGFRVGSSHDEADRRPV
jgi:hypothetical protein